MEQIRVQQVPAEGFPNLGDVYRRADLHLRFGGNVQKGIVPSTREPIILLFHTQEKVNQFYKDGFDEDEIYWYSGEGFTGDMTWGVANTSIRDHIETGKELLLFERAQRKEGLWRFMGSVQCIGHKREMRPDRAGNLRSAIVFGLSKVNIYSECNSTNMFDADINEIRRIAIQVDPDQNEPLSDPLKRMVTIRNRSKNVRTYAILRAAGLCEACGMSAPFVTSNGDPFLEVHHIDRLGDGGLDRIDRVAAVCPNCHRRCHHSLDAIPYNQGLKKLVLTKEAINLSKFK